MTTDMKLQNEVKIRLPHVSRTDLEFKAVNDCIQKLFRNIDFDEDKDWNITFTLKNDPEAGTRAFTGTLKMTDKQITSRQLQIFSEPAEELSIAN